MDSDQTAAHTSQMNETGYAVIPAIVGAAELEEIAWSVDGLVHEGFGTRRLIELPWCSELAERLMRDHRVSGALLASHQGSRVLTKGLLGSVPARIRAPWVAAQSNPA